VEVETLHFMDAQLFSGGPCNGNTFSKKIKPWLRLLRVKSEAKRYGITNSREVLELRIAGKLVVKITMWLPFYRICYVNQKTMGIRRGVYTIEFSCE